MTTTNQQSSVVQTFKYDQLDTDTSAHCHRTAQLASTFMQFARRTIDKGLELGEHLIQVKEKLPHGQYMPYVASIGVPYQVAAYWTRVVREKRQLETEEIFDIKYLPEEATAKDQISHIGYLPEHTQQPYTYATTAEEALEHSNKTVTDYLREDLSDILVEEQPDTTEIDVAATVAENERLKKANAHLGVQVQDALRQQTTQQPRAIKNPYPYIDKSHPKKEYKDTDQMRQEFEQRRLDWFTLARHIPTKYQVIPGQGIEIRNSDYSMVNVIPTEQIEWLRDFCNECLDSLTPVS